MMDKSEFEQLETEMTILYKIQLLSRAYEIKDDEFRSDYVHNLMASIDALLAAYREKYGTVSFVKLLLRIYSKNGF